MLYSLCLEHGWSYNAQKILTDDKKDKSMFSFLNSIQHHDVGFELHNWPSMQVFIFHLYLDAPVASLPMEIKSYFYIWIMFS